MKRKTIIPEKPLSPEQIAANKAHAEAVIHAMAGVEESWDFYFKAGPSLVGRLYLGSISGNKEFACAEAKKRWPKYRPIMICKLNRNFRQRKENP